MVSSFWPHSNQFSFILLFRLKQWPLDPAYIDKVDIESG